MSPRIYLNDFYSNCNVKSSNQYGWLLLNCKDFYFQRTVNNKWQLRYLQWPLFWAPHLSAASGSLFPLLLGRCFVGIVSSSPGLLTQLFHWDVTSLGTLVILGSYQELSYSSSEEPFTGSFPQTEISSTAMKPSSTWVPCYLGKLHHPGTAISRRLAINFPSLFEMLQKSTFP